MYNMYFSTSYRVDVIGDHMAIRIHVNQSPCVFIWLHIVACQAHPALVKIGLVLARLFHVNSLLVRKC